MKTRNASLAEKVAGVAVADLVGSSNKAGELLGISPRSIRKWREEGRTDPEIARLVARTTAEAKDALVLEIAEMLPSLAGFVATKVREMIETNAAVTPRDLQALSTVGGIWLDKLAGLDRARDSNPYQPGEDQPVPSLAPPRLLHDASQDASGTGEEPVA